MSNFLISITSFKKNTALKVLLESLRQFGYDQDIIVADDNCNKHDSTGLTAEEVCKNIPGNVYLTYNEKASQLGVARNKNRGIKFFLENPQYSHLICLDDDLQMVGPGLIERLELIQKQYNLHHINGYWTDESSWQSSKLVGISGRSWHEDFPVILENDHVTWSYGCQGVMLFITKEMCEQVGYFRSDYLYFYGTEHSEWSSRILATSGWATGIGAEKPLFPTMKRAERYYVGQNIPNNYSITMDKVELNMKHYEKCLTETRLGINLKCDEHGLPKKGEKCMKI